MQRSQDWVPATCGAGLTFAIEDADEETLCIVSLNGPADSLRRGRANISAKPCQSRPVGRGRFLLGSWGAKTNGGMAQAQASAGYAFRLSCATMFWRATPEVAPALRLTTSIASTAICSTSTPRATGWLSRPSTSTMRATSFTMTFPTPKPGTVVSSRSRATWAQFRLSYELLTG